MLVLLVVLHIIPAKKSKRSKSQCPGMPASRQKSFDDVLQYAAEISTAHRSLEAHDCFALAVSLAVDGKERNIALYNLAVVQKDLRRSTAWISLFAESPSCILPDFYYLHPISSLAASSSSCIYSHHSIAFTGISDPPS